MLTKQLRALFAALLMLWPSSAALSYQSQEPLVKLDTSLVLVDATVLSKKTKAVVSDLKREDFTLQENGTRQEIAHFSREELPLSVVLLLDVSASVRPVIREVRRATLDAMSRLKPSDKVALMVFAERPVVIAELTTDRAQIMKRMDRSANVGWSTSIHRGIHEAARYLRQKTEPSERRAIVIITDDQDTVGPWPPPDAVLKELYEGGTVLCGILVKHVKVPRTATSASSTAVSITNLASGGMLITRKILRSTSERTDNTKFYAEHTGGVAISAHNCDEVARLFVETMEMLRARYTLGYYPPDLPADGKLREIQLAVNAHVQKGKGEVKVLARQGYYPNKPLPHF